MGFGALGERAMFAWRLVRTTLHRERDAGFVALAWQRNACSSQRASFNITLPHAALRDAPPEPTSAGGVPRTGC